MRKKQFVPLFFLAGTFVLSSCGGSADAGSSANPSASAQPAPSSPPTNTIAGPVAPAGAELIDHIEDRKPWDHCSACAAHPANRNPPIALWEFQQNQQTPSLDGSSVRFFLGGSVPYGNALHTTKFGPRSDKRNFIFEYDVYASPESLRAQNLEFDLFQGVSQREYMFGMQCNYAKGIWQGWNGPAIAWVDFAQAPCKKFEPGKWTHVKWRLERTSDNKLHYISVTVGGTTWNVDNYQSPVWNSYWADVLGIQMQQDLNVNADDYAIWVDGIKVWAW